MNDTATRIRSLTERLVAIRSVAGNPEGLEASLSCALAELPGYTVERFERNGIKSALVYNTEARPGRFTFLLNCHLDVIPAKDEQFTPRIEGDRLIGAGAMDMKGNLAAALVAFDEVAKTLKTPVALQLVTDEEEGGFDGTKLQVEKGVRADFVLATEPTNFDIVNQARGVLKLHITTHGVTAHGAYPWRGDNAVWKMHEFLTALKAAYPLPTKEGWETTVNVGMLSTDNTAFNKIPDTCTVGIDVRFVSEDSERVLPSILALLPEGTTYDILANEAALFTEKTNEYLAALSKIAADTLGAPVSVRGAQGTSDARHFQVVDCPGIEFGPVGGGIGSDDEWVDLPSLLKYHGIITAFLRSLDA